LYAVDADDNRPLPVMTPAEISALPIGTCLILRNTLRPVIGTAPMIWDRQPSRNSLAVRRALAGARRWARERPVDLRPARTRPAPGAATAAAAGASTEQTGPGWPEASSGTPAPAAKRPHLSVVDASDFDSDSGADAVGVDPAGDGGAA
jgi:hypothetical protein